MRYIMLIFAQVWYWTVLLFQGCCVLHLLWYRLISQPAKLNKHLFPMDLCSLEQLSCEHLFLTYGRDLKCIIQFWLGRGQLGGHVMARDHYEAVPCFKRLLVGLSLQKRWTNSRWYGFLAKHSGFPNEYHSTNVRYLLNICHQCYLNLAVESVINPLAPELFFLISAHPVYKM